MILGGFDENADEFLNDGWTFDTTTDAIQQVVHSSESNPYFWSHDNQHHMLRKDMIIAFVDDDDEESIVEFRKGSDKIREI